MEIFDTIAEHSRAMRLPLYAVTLTAAAKRDTPVLLILHWHGFLRETQVAVEGVAIPPRAVAGSAIQIDLPWHEVASLDRDLLDAAWRLGAWEVEREARRPWWRLGAPARDTLACWRAFGNYPDAPAGEETLVSAAPDREALMAMAAHKGYLRWTFRPRKGGIWGQVDDEDSTLEHDGGRAPPCPVAPRPVRTERDGRTVYRLGRVDHLIRV
ncbi:MAG: diguanylate cyclase [Bordetella sp.]|uniref:diguanylate cyclase n=1 Tax=Bordetella sp. TaxID=28081 RepID=UPI003F7B3C9D